MATDRARGTAEQVGDLGVGQSLEVAQHQHGLLSAGQLVQLTRQDDPLGVLLGEGGRRRRVGFEEGNWNLIHRVDLPPGWEIKTQLISPDSESTSFGPVGATDGEEPSTCQVDLWAPGRGDPTAGRADRTPVTVNGRPAYYSDDSQVAEVWGVSWEYQPGAFAVASCGDAELAEDVAAAERVRLETVPVRLPFRLRSLPRGYAGQVLFPPVANSEGRIPGGVQFTAPDNGGRPYFAVVVQPGRTEIPPGLAGWETDTIKGVPAVLSARDARLCLNLDRHTACIEAASGEAADLTRSLWAAGRRELLVDVAERLVVAQDPDNPDTWFPADRAIPD